MTHDDLWQEWTRKGIDSLAVFDVDPNEYYAIQPALLNPNVSEEDYFFWKQEQKLKDDLNGEYHSLSQELHPDRLREFPPSLIEQAAKLLANVTTIYEVLTNPKRYEEIQGTAPSTSPMMEYVQSLHTTGSRFRDHPARRDVELMMAKKAIMLELRATTDSVPPTPQLPSQDVERYRREAEDYRKRWEQCSNALSRYEILGTPDEILRIPELVGRLGEIPTLRTALEGLQTELETAHIQVEERDAAIALFAELTSGRTKTPPYGFSSP